MSSSETTMYEMSNVSRRRSRVSHIASVVPVRTGTAPERASRPASAPNCAAIHRGIRYPHHHQIDVDLQLRKSLPRRLAQQGDFLRRHRLSRIRADRTHGAERRTALTVICICREKSLGESRRNAAQCGWGVFVSAGVPGRRSDGLEGKARRPLIRGDTAQDGFSDDLEDRDNVRDEGNDAERSANQAHDLPPSNGYTSMTADTSIGSLHHRRVIASCGTRKREVRKPAEAAGSGRCR